MPEHPNPDATGGLRAVSRAMRAPIDKAARLVAENRVAPVPTARVYRVQGDSATYHVIATPDGIFCPCEARTPLCSHVLAVAHIRTRESVPTSNGNGGMRVIS